MALGAGETTVLRLVSAYAIIANGGQSLEPTLIDRIQDRYGRTIYKHDQRVCTDCNSPEYDGQGEPALVDERDQVLDPMTAYQITSMMEGVVQRGTATVVKQLGVPIAGKTGTTNDEKDVWFVGFTPNLVCGVFIGYDNPKPLGRGVVGGNTSAPVFVDFMKDALKGKPAVDFKVPEGMQLIAVNRKTGMSAQRIRARRHHRGLQARHGTGGYLFGDRRRRRRPGAGLGHRLAAGRAGDQPGRGRPLLDAAAFHP